MDLDPSALWDFAGEIVGTVRPTVPAQRATVTRIDSEGTVWVKTPDGAEAPAAECGADVRPGDEVTLGFDGARMSVDANVSNPPAASSVVDRVREIAGTAKDIASAVGQHFWFDGNGAHVSTEANDPAGRQNTIWNSLGMLFRRGQNIVLAIVTGSDPGIEIYDGAGNDAENLTASFKADETHLGMSGAGAVYMGKDNVIITGSTRGTESATTTQKIVETSYGIKKYTTEVNLLDVEVDQCIATSINDYLLSDDEGPHGDPYEEHRLDAHTTLKCDLDESTYVYNTTARIDVGSQVDFVKDGSTVETEENRSYINIWADDVTVTTGDDAFTVGNPVEDARYGSVSQSTNVSLTSGTGKAICSHEFGPGVYVIVGHVQFASNATGYRACAFSTTSGSVPNNGYTSMQARVPAVNGVQTHLNIITIFNVTTIATLYLNALQTSGGALNAVGQMRWVRIL